MPERVAPNGEIEQPLTYRERMGRVRARMLALNAITPPEWTSKRPTPNHVRLT